MAHIKNKGTKKNPNYMYRVYVGKDSITGRDKQKSQSGFKSKRDAEIAAAIVERQFFSNEYIQPDNTTLEELATLWLDTYGLEVKESTLKMRKQAIKKFIASQGNSPVQKVTEHKYQSFISSMAKQYKPNHVKIIHTSIKMLFQYAIEKTRLINKSPCEHAKLPKEKRTIEDIENEATSYNYMERDELEQFLTVAKEKGLYNDFPMFSTLAYSGCRIGELRSIKWSDIDYDEHTLRISKTMHNVTNNRMKFELSTPKTEKSARTITLDPFIIELLKQHKTEQEQVKRDNRDLYDEHNFIFASNDGYPLTVTLINDRMKRLLSHTDINKHLSSHSFRHTHTSLLIEADVHIKEIQERLGHSSFQTTMNIYASMTKNMKENASTKFSNLMKNVSEKLI